MKTAVAWAVGLSALLAVALAGAQPPAAHAPAAADYSGVVRQNDVMVPARDGVLLATDIYRPARAGAAASERLPVLLHRTPYDKSEPATVAIAETLAQNGYVVIIQDTRGRHRSQGVFVKYYDYDAYDGYDTIEWAARLPYSNGKVGMYGTSYAAHTQADASKLHPPHLSTLILNMGGMSNAWDHSVRYDGAFEMGRQLTWAWSQALEDAKDPITKSMLSKEKVIDWYSALPLRKGQSPLAIAPTFEGYYLDEATRSDYDAHWQTLGMQWQKYYAQTADVPMLHVGGWYDIYLRGTIDNFRSLAALKKSPMRLLIGPWTHHGNTADYAGDVEFGPAAAITDFDTAFHLRWFDYYLKGRRTAAAAQAPVQLFLDGYRRRPQRRARPPVPRWGLARRESMAARRSASHRVLSARRRVAVSDYSASGRTRLHDLSLRSRSPRADHRRRRVQAPSGRRLRSARTARYAGLARAVPAAARAP